MTSLVAVLVFMIAAAEATTPVLDRISPAENAKLQVRCRNPEFTTTSDAAAQPAAVNAVSSPLSWLANFQLKLPNGKWGYLCGATLITQRHLITARHCIAYVHQPGETVAPIRVLVGGRCLVKTPAKGCVERDVIEATVDMVLYQKPLDEGTHPSLTSSQLSTS